MSSSTEAGLQEHYKLLREYLESQLASLANRPTSQAMQRVSRLPSEQFFEVSNDLYDELRRRLSNPDDLPFLPIRPELPSKRNQARQKMATLPDARFKELAAELYVEIERRFPQIVAEVAAKTSTSSSSRSKEGRSRRAEKEERTGSERSFGNVSTDGASVGAAAASGGGSRRSKREPSSSSRGGGRERERSRGPSNRYPSFKSEESVGRMAASGSNGRNGSTGIDSSDAESEIAKIRSDYEFKIAMMEKQIKTSAAGGEQVKILQTQIAKMEQNSMLMQGDYDRLQSDYDRLQADYDQLVIDFQKKSQELSTVDQRYQAIESEFQQVRRDYDILQDDFEREQKITADLETKLIQTKDDFKRLQTETADNVQLIEKLRASEASFLTDIQVLKEKARSAESGKDNLTKENQRLRDELKRNNGGVSTTSSIPRSLSPTSYNTKDDSKVPMKSPSRVISPAQSVKTIREGEMDSPDPIYRDFQKSSYDLSDAAKSSRREQVLGPMKSILLICKEITQECESVEASPGLSSSDKKTLRDTKGRLSESLTFLMQAAKEHASNNGPSLLKKIEDELKTLSYCVVDLLDVLKAVQGGGISNPPSALPQDSNRDTLRSIDPPTSRPVSYGADGEPPALELPELLDYIKDQIGLMDDHIKDLLQVMLKASASGDELSNLASKIASCVDKIIYETQGTLDISTKMNADVIADADAIVADMGDINNELLDYGEDILDAPGDRSIKQKIANTSYEIAKQSKELLSVLQSA